MKNDNKKGFTLIELLVVLAILAILAIIVFAAVMPLLEKAQKSAFITEAKLVYKEANNKKIDNTFSYDQIVKTGDLDLLNDRLMYSVSFNASTEGIRSIKVAKKIGNKYFCINQAGDFLDSATYESVFVTKKLEECNLENFIDGEVITVRLDSTSPLKNVSDLVSEANPTLLYLRYNKGWYKSLDTAILNTDKISNITSPIYSNNYVYDGYYHNKEKIIEKDGSIFKNTFDENILEPIVTLTSNVRPKRYNIKYHSCGGQLLEEESSTEYLQREQVKNISILDTDKKVEGEIFKLVGHSFAGWSDVGCTNTVKYLSNQNIDSTFELEGATKELYAQWTPNPYKVTFSRQGGIWDDGSTVDNPDKYDRTISYNSNYGELPKTKKTGYTFKGWYTKVSGGEKFNSNTSVTNDIMLYARWEVNKYTITLNESSTSPIYEIYNDEFVNSGGNEVTTVVKPTKTGHTFSGYSYNGTQIIDSTGKIKVAANHFTSNVTLEPQFTANTYNISYELDKGSYGSSHPTSATYDTVTTISNPTKTVTVNYTNNVRATLSGGLANGGKASYTFKGWIGSNLTSTTAKVGSSAWSGSATTGTSFKNLTTTNGGTVTLTATWEAPKVQLPTVTKTGYTCNWKSDEYTYASGGTYSPVSTGGATTRTFTVNCTPNTYKVYYYGNDATSQRYNNNESCNTDGKTCGLDRFTSGSTYDSTNKRFKHETIRKYDVSFNLLNNLFYKTGYKFNGWNTKSDGTGTSYANKAEVKNLTSTNGGTVKLYAQWTPQIYTITLDKNSGSGGTNTIYEKYDNNFSLNSSGSPSMTTSSNAITKPTRTGYTFEGYYTATSDGTQIIGSNGYIISGKYSTFTSPQTLYAHWKLVDPFASYTKCTISGTTTSWRANSNCLNTTSSTTCSDRYKESGYCDFWGYIRPESTVYLVDRSYKSESVAFAYAYVTKASINTPGYGNENSESKAGTCSAYNSNIEVCIKDDPRDCDSKNKKTYPAKVTYNGTDYYLVRFDAWRGKNSAGYQVKEDACKKIIKP